MSREDDLRKLDEVRADELKSILQRRKTARLPKAERALAQHLTDMSPDKPGSTLAGLSLSGGHYLVKPRLFSTSGWSAWS